MIRPLPLKSCGPRSGRFPVDRTRRNAVQAVELPVAITFRPHNPPGPTMEENKKNSQFARLLAVLALIGTILIVIVAISGATGGDDDGTTKKANPGKQQQANRPKTNAKTYEVEEGDNLITISQKTGISVQRLEKLNPDLDPQALQLGQEIKLR